MTICSRCRNRSPPHRLKAFGPTRPRMAEPLGLYWDSGSSWRNSFARIDQAKLLVLQGKSGARGIRTLDGRFHPYRISSAAPSAN